MALGAPIPPSILPSKLDELRTIAFADVVPPVFDVESERHPPLPPRPDPSHVNQLPELPQNLAVPRDRPPIVLLKVLVLPNGSIGEAIIEGTSGFANLDDAARSFVLAHWHFLPAFRENGFVADWISVEVPFSS